MPEGNTVAPRSKRRLQTAYRTITAGALVSFFAATSLHQYLGVTRPKHADPLSGRILALACHGVVFITRTEQRTLLSLFAIAILGIVVAVVLRVMHEGLHHRTEPR